jgi:hypothetical protein
VAGFSHQSLVLFICNLITFGILFVWPAIKTFAGLQRKMHCGRWGLYWIGVPFLYVVVRLLAVVLRNWRLFPLAEVLLAIILTWHNGTLVRGFTTLFIKYILAANYHMIRGLPSRVPALLGQVFTFVLQLVTSGRAAARKD